MYKNYGDMHFFEHGRLVDTEHSDTEFSVLYCEPYPDEEDLYQFAELTVDITDDWIDADAVREFGSIPAGEGPVGFALDAIDYYGPENFGAYDSFPYSGDWRYMTRAQIMGILKYHMIDYSNVSLDV